MRVSGCPRYQRFEARPLQSLHYFKIGVGLFYYQLKTFVAHALRRGETPSDLWNRETGLASVKSGVTAMAVTSFLDRNPLWSAVTASNKGRNRALRFGIFRSRTWLSGRVGQGFRGCHQYLPIFL
jgi:hypothetical protein